jgi:lipopolysaccharide exporter
MNVATWIRKNEFILNVSKLITGTALGQLITLLVSPILTRLYTSSDFGILAVYFSFASILSVIITLRFDMAILLPVEEEEAIDLVILGLVVSFVLSCFLFTNFWIFNTYIIEIINHPEVEFYLYLIPLSTFFYGSYQVLSYWETRIKKYNQLAISKTVKELSTAITQLSMGTIYYSGALGLVSGQISGNAIATGYLFSKTLNQINSRLIKGLWKNLRNVFQKYKKFPLYTSWASLVSAISQNIPAILLALLYSPAIAGFYAIASRVLTVPSILIGNSVRQVYYQKASFLRNNDEQISNIFKKTTLYLALIAFIPVVIVIIWGEPLFTIIFGPTWGEAGLYASILSIWLFFSFMNPPTNVNFLILELNRLQLILEFLILIIRILALLIGYFIYNNVLMSLMLFSAVGAFYQLSLIIYMYFKLK